MAIEANSASLTWIVTRDGSPTLWHNELGESFRSTKGAWTESWECFVEPGLSRNLNQATVVEFGLGAGTNWWMWSLAHHLLGSRVGAYWAIEKNLEAFHQGLTRWKELEVPLTQFLMSKLGLSASAELQPFLPLHPKVVSSIDDLPPAITDLWFHDPFGFDVNPDGYSEATLSAAKRSWKSGTRGFSYACNRHFVRALETTGCKPQVIPTQSPLLKRERLEFLYP